MSDVFCCKCKSHLLPFEIYRNEETNLPFCAYCKQKLIKFIRGKNEERNKSLSIWKFPSDEEINNYVKEFVNDN